MLGFDWIWSWICPFFQFSIIQNPSIAGTHTQMYICKSLQIIGIFLLYEVQMISLNVFLYPEVLPAHLPWQETMPNFMDNIALELPKRQRILQRSLSKAKGKATLPSMRLIKAIENDALFFLFFE